MTSPDEAYGGSQRSFAAGTATPTRGAAAAGARPASAARTASGPRRVRLTLARLDPWSVMKLSFLLSVAVGIALVIMIGVLWTTLDGMGVFDSVNSTIKEISSGGTSQSTFDLMNYIGFSRVLSLATVIAVVDVFLLTALSTLGAFLYNVCSSLVGGLHLTLTDD